MSATTNLAARLAALEQQVATLRGQAAGGEQLSPNYLTANADGTVGASFTGRVHAAGLDIDAASVPAPPSTNMVRWLNGNSQVAILVGNSSSGVEELDVNAYALAAGDRSRITLNAEDDQANGHATLEVRQDSRGAGALIHAITAARDLTILDQAGQSGLLQLLSTQKLQLQIGTVTVTVNNGGAAAYAFNLPTAWPAAHTQCAVWVVGAPNIGALSYFGGGANGLSQGVVYLANSAAAQNVNVGFISFGN